MAPLNPVHTAVTNVATIRHVIALIIVLLCVSVNSILHKKAPFGANTILLADLTFDIHDWLDAHHPATIRV